MKSTNYLPKAFQALIRQYAVCTDEELKLELKEVVSRAWNMSHSEIEQIEAQLKAALQTKSVYELFDFKTAVGIKFTTFDELQTNLDMFADKSRPIFVQRHVFESWLADKQMSNTFSPTLDVATLKEGYLGTIFEGQVVLSDAFELHLKELKNNHVYYQPVAQP